MDQKIRMVTVSTFALLGILCISSGAMYSSMQANDEQQKVLVVVQQKRISNTDETIDLKLKNLEIEANTPLSVRVIDYLDCAVTDEVLGNLKLDTSTVNVTQPGTYSYTVSYLDQTFTGQIVVLEKTTEPEAQTITLKTLNIKVGTVLSTDIADYIVETLSDEVKAQMTLDLSQVNTSQAATYQYTITYQNSIYTSNIIVTNDQPTLATGNNDTSTSETTETSEQGESSTTTGEENSSNTTEKVE